VLATRRDRGRERHVSRRGQDRLRLLHEGLGADVTAVSGQVQGDQGPEADTRHDHWPDAAGLDRSGDDCGCGLDGMLGTLGDGRGAVARKVDSDGRPAGVGETGTVLDHGLAGSRGVVQVDDRGTPGPEAPDVDVAVGEGDVASVRPRPGCRTPGRISDGVHKILSLVENEFSHSGKL
jgi:hypothetical protein